MMTFEESIPNSITLQYGRTKLILVLFKSLNNALQYRMSKNEYKVVKYSV